MLREGRRRSAGGRRKLVLEEIFEDAAWEAPVYSTTFSQPGIPAGRPSSHRTVAQSSEALQLPLHFALRDPAGRPRSHRPVAQSSEALQLPLHSGSLGFPRRGPVLIEPWPNPRKLCSFRYIFALRDPRGEGQFSSTSDLIIGSFAASATFSPSGIPVGRPSSHRPVAQSSEALQLPLHSRSQGSRGEAQFSSTRGPIIGSFAASATFSPSGIPVGRPSPIEPWPNHRKLCRCRYIFALRDPRGEASFSSTRGPIIGSFAVSATFWPGIPAGRREKIDLAKFAKWPKISKIELIVRCSARRKSSGEFCLGGGLKPGFRDRFR